MNKNILAIAIAVTALISFLSLGWMMTNKIEKLELALNVLTQGGYETTTAAELKQVLSTMKPNAPAPAKN